MVKAVCESGHAFEWTSSAIVQHETKSQSAFYALDVAVSSAVVVTGCNYLRLQRWAHVSRLFIYNRMQVIIGFCVIGRKYSMGIGDSSFSCPKRSMRSGGRKMLATGIR